MTKDIYKTTKNFYNKIGKVYLEKIKKGAPFKKRNEFMKLVKRKGKILDVGCAGGRDTKIFISKGFRCVGIDFSKVFIREAKKYEPRGKFISMDLRKLKFPKAHFDGIWAQAVLLHTDKKDLPNILKKFKNILKPQGVLFVGVKEGKGIGVIRENLTAGMERQSLFFQKKEITQLIKNAGFKILSSEIGKDALKRKEVSWILVISQNN